MSPLHRIATEEAFSVPKGAAGLQQLVRER